jgi:hypothetical protein
MTQNWTGSTGNKTGNLKIQNFLEALRHSQTDSPKTSESSAGKNIFAEIQAKKEIEKLRIEQFHHQRNQEWNKVFSSKEIQTEKKIEYIREQLKQLGQQLKKLDQNLFKAIESPVVVAGIYQEGFLEHLQKTLHLYGLKVNSANSWLEVYQSRSKKQGVYWGMAKTKGTSYTQNNERSVATSIG